METVDTPKYLTPPGSHHHSPSACLELDARWGLARIYQEERRCKPTWTCGCSFRCVHPTLTPLLAIRRRKGPLLPPLLQRNPRGPQGSTWSFYISFRHRIDAVSAKHPRGRLPLCAYRGFRPRQSHPKPGFYAEHLASELSQRTMDCARGFERGDM